MLAKFQQMYFSRKASLAGNIYVWFLSILANSLDCPHHCDDCYVALCFLFSKLNREFFWTRVLLDPENVLLDNDNK